jgi:uncharacterized phage protein gp47/JayE
VAFETPSLDDNHLFLIQLLSNLLPGANVAEGAFNWLWLKTLAAGAAGNDAHIDATKDELLADSAVDNLARISKLVPGGEVPRKTATPARKSNALRVTGTAASPVPAGGLLTSSSGVTLRIDDSNIIGPGGYVDVDLVAVDLGSVGRLPAGETLTYTAAPAGIDDDAILVLALDEGGDDLEPIESWRARILSKLRLTPRGGMAEDFVQWATAQQGIASAYTLPLRAGWNTVDVVGLHAGSGDTRALQLPEVADLQAALDKLRNIGMKQMRVLKTATDAVDVELLIVESPEAKYAFDWNDTTSPVVAAFDAATNIMTLDFVPEDVTVGSRMSFYPFGGVGGTGAERVVDAMGPGGNQVTLEADDSADVPVAFDIVYAGGAVVQPVRAAILAFFAALGPANKGKKYGAWEGSVSPKALERIAASVPGVTDDSSCLLPGNTVEADDLPAPDDDTIGLLIAGRILVHRDNS